MLCCCLLTGQPAKAQSAVGTNASCSLTALVSPTSSRTQRWKTSECCRKLRVLLTSDSPMCAVPPLPPSLQKSARSPSCLRTVASRVTEWSEEKTPLSVPILGRQFWGIEAKVYRKSTLNVEVQSSTRDTS